MAWRFLAVLTVSTVGCGGTVFLNRPMGRSADAWTIEVASIHDGPDTFFDLLGIWHHAGRGRRLIWVTLTIRNDAPHARTFNFNRCDVDDGDAAVLPTIIHADSFVTWSMDRETKMDPGDAIVRRIAFVYPEQSSPTRLSCPPLSISLAGFPERIVHPNER